jgi:hypothetical protein
MTVFAPATLWPPRVGDYARVRGAGILGEVISVTHRGSDYRYTLNVFDPAVNEPLVYRLDELEPVWDGQPERGAGQAWDEAPPTWSTTWPSWTH